jgi:hypothetical protein
MLNDRSVDAYLNALVDRLARNAPGAEYPYQIKAVNAGEVNAFALPGGYMYVYRGLVEAAATEGELAGVLAHEMAHVALRHGTNQASKAYLAQAGLGLLGGLIGGDDGRPDKIVSAIGGVGLNALFLKYSRDAETQADMVGAQMMARAGYDPEEMATFFDKLAGMRRRDPSRLEQFFSSHPPPAGRAQRIRQEASRIGPPARTRELGGFADVKAELQGRPPAPRERAAALQDYADRQESRQYPAGAPDVSVEPPSGFRTYSHPAGFFEISVPEGWRVVEDTGGYGVTLAPQGGIVNSRDGTPILVCGVVVNHYVPFDESRLAGPVSLEDATRDLMGQILRANPHLEVQPASSRRGQLDGAPAISSSLAGRSPATGEEERVTLYTRSLADDHVLYALFVAPARTRAVEDAFWRMVDSLRVDDRAAHR